MRISVFCKVWLTNLPAAPPAQRCDELHGAADLPGVVIACRRVTVANPMADARSHNALHGVTLERLVTELAGALGWAELGRRVPVRCFLYEPSIKSSLTFLRKTPWARAKVEQLYVDWKAGA